MHRKGCQGRKDSGGVRIVNTNLKRVKNRSNDGKKGMLALSSTLGDTEEIKVHGIPSH